MTLLSRRGCFALAAGAITLLSSTVASAQDWPTKQPIKFVASLQPGGLVDLFARAYGDYISTKLGQTIIVENKPGASGSLAAQAVKSAPADGYTFLFSLTGTLVQNKILVKNLPYDPDKDFVLVSSMFSGQLPFLAAKATGAKTLAEFIAYARNNPVSVGTWGAGSGAHLAVEALNQQYGLKMVAVHYRGEAPMWQDFNAGVLQGGMGSYVNTAGVIDGGFGVPIAVNTTSRLKRLPNVPTFIEQGAVSKYYPLKGFIFLAASTGTPPEIVNRMSELMVEAGKSERVRKVLDSFGIDEAAVGAAEFRKLFDEEAPVWLELVKALGLAAQ
jgi:tripartite-type tricarboxylate transporter receptor subunit TctC